ncbi:MAG: class I SAM-dependent methyltransferase [Patescibacteria group bacterium]
MASRELHKKLNELREVFDFEKVLSISADNKYIQKYYRVNQIPYSVFHTHTDLMYMGISRDGVYKESDLLAHARFVDGYIKKYCAKKVLEIATGRGANSAYLAKMNPEVQFYGIDLSPGQLAYAEKRGRRFPNYFPTQGDYHDLSRYAPDTFDIVFVVEALCYSREKEKVLDEVYRVLKKGGYFIISDGYRSASNLDEAEKLACRLCERGMALEVFDTYDEFLRVIKLSKFSIAHEEDVSTCIMPTLYKFESLARKFLKCKRCAKWALMILPSAFVNNFISAYLMPTIVKDRIGSYWITVLKKQGS